MATSTIPKALKTRIITVSGTTDSNGFLTTSLKYNEVIVLAGISLIKNGMPLTAFFVDALARGGDGGQYIGIRFRSWNGDAINGTISADIVIGE